MNRDLRLLRSENSGSSRHTRSGTHRPRAHCWAKVPRATSPSSGPSDDCACGSFPTGAAAYVSARIHAASFGMKVDLARRPRSRAHRAHHPSSLRALQARFVPADANACRGKRRFTRDDGYGSRLCDPSQNGLVPECLQPHQAIVFASLISTAIGVNPPGAVLCEPSQ